MVIIPIFEFLHEYTYSYEFKRNRICKICKIYRIYKICKIYKIYEIYRIYESNKIYQICKIYIITNLNFFSKKPIDFSGKNL